MEAVEEKKLDRKDFIPDVDVRWCPGCGDYAILNAIQKVFPTLGIPRENFVVVSGIGCSSRFPYYMKTYGFHTIHGRAPAVATGLKVANPDLSVWMVTGDGDGLSIGGNHLLHLLRRNVNVNILLFNNKIYGLTKGQYSPTSEVGKVTKSSPLGSVEHPIHPVSFALSSESTFVARTIDTNPRHMTEVFAAAAAHPGTSFVEILQNCVIFNHQAWAGISGRDVREDRLLFLQDQKPLVFGKEGRKGIRLNGLRPEIVTIGENGIELNDILMHSANREDPTYAFLLSQLRYPDFPTPMGVFRSVNNRGVFEVQLQEQIKSSLQKIGPGNLKRLMQGREYWKVKESSQGDTQSIPVTVRAPHNTEEMEIMEERREAATRMESDPMMAVLKHRIGQAVQRFGSDTIVSVRPDEPISRAIQIFKNHEIGCIPVMDRGSLVGILSERDVLLKVVLVSVDRDHAVISTVMTPHVNTLKYWNTIGDAINKLAIGGFRHLPIETREGKVGLISVKGLLNYIYQNVHPSQAPSV